MFTKPPSPSRYFQWYFSNRSPTLDWSISSTVCRSLQQARDMLLYRSLAFPLLSVQRRRIQRCMPPSLVEQRRLLSSICRMGEGSMGMPLSIPQRRLGRIHYTLYVRFWIWITYLYEHLQARRRDTSWVY